MQINAHWPVIDYYAYNAQHYLAETDGLNLYESQQAVLAALQQRHSTCQVAGKAPFVEFLFPVMMHTAAQAGINLCPKVLKETCGPIMLAVAMGAARQYGVSLGVDVDYWWHNETIGHSAERFHSAFHGGSNPTIFNTPNELPEEEIESGLRPVMEKGMVLVVHCPPLGTLDLTSVNRHAGSVAIARLVEEFRPRVVLSGHIHEARGIVEKDGTLYMNPGAAKDGFSAVIELGAEAKATLLDRSPEE